MQKAIFLLLTSFTNFSFTFCQDIIVMTNGDEIQAKVIEILPDLVKYKKFINIDGPTISEYRSKIFMIKYQNGTKDVFKSEPQNQTQPQVQISKSSSAEEDKNMAVKKLESYFINGFKNVKSPTMSLISFKKVNGVVLNLGGESVYEIYFEITLQFLKDVWMKGNAAQGYWRNDFRTYDKKPDLRASGEQYIFDLKFYPRGMTYLLQGIGYMTQSDNGYQVQKHEIKSVTEIGLKQMQQVNTSNSIIKSETSNTGEPLKLTTDEYKSYFGFLTTEQSNYILKIQQIKVADKLNNDVLTREKVLESLKNMRRIKASNMPVSGPQPDTLNLSVNAIFSYRNYSSATKLAYFADCEFQLVLANSSNNQNPISKVYKLSNYALLSSGFSSEVDAQRNLISNQFNQALSQFIIGTFPVKGEITEITEKNRKGDEVKFVRINLGRKDGLFRGYIFNLTDFTNKTNKPDITVNEVFEDYSIAKVDQNHKIILNEIGAGKKLKIITSYKP